MLELQNRSNELTRDPKMDKFLAEPKKDKTLYENKVIIFTEAGDTVRWMIQDRNSWVIRFQNLRR